MMQSQSGVTSLHSERYGLRVVVACLLLLLAVGCGRSGPEIVPVAGTITYGGGPWPKSGVVFFVVEASAPGQPNRPAMGEFNANGNLAVTTFKKGDGLIPGKYMIAVECWEVRPEMGQKTTPKSYVPARYGAASTSGLTVTVEPGQKSVTLKLDVAKN